jgi:diaminopimelate epimerase
MAQTLPFLKYSAHGNNFVLIDELHGQVVEEAAKPALSRFLLDRDFGVGGDDVIFLQKASPELFVDVARERGYWDTASPEQRAAVGAVFSNGAAELVAFRLFEPDGTEALVCGNGMRCAASYLGDRHGLQAPLFLTELPTRCPSLRRAHVIQGKSAEFGRSVAAVDMGLAVPLPREFLGSLLDSLRTLRDTIGSPTVGRAAGSTELRGFSLGIHGVYTGEPYVVAFQPDTLPDEGSPEHLAFLHWSIDVNRPSSSFPFGMNTVLASVRNRHEIEFRVFERIKNFETGASGSGAVAVAAVASALDLVDPGAPIRTFPVKGLRSAAAAGIEAPVGPITVTRDADGCWTQEGVVLRVFEGTVKLPSLSLVAQPQEGATEPLAAAHFPSAG